MIPTRAAKAQALRLSALSGYDEREPEIERALERNASDLEHAASIVSRLLGLHAMSRQAPSADEIVTLAAKTDPENNPRQWRCASCDGTGFRQVYQLHTWRGENRKDVEAISREQYDRLRERCAGLVGEQAAVAAVGRCDECALGRRGADAERRDRAEERIKRAAQEEKRMVKSKANGKARVNTHPQDFGPEDRDE